MERLVASLPLSSGQQLKLKTAGFNVADDLKGLSVAELSKELDLPASEALQILDAVKSSFGMGQPVGMSSATADRPTSQGQTALDLLRVEQERTNIVTFSAKVDEMLGGGIALGKITELCGAPGIGKTQFSMQLAVDVSIPEQFGGAEGEAVYIDTEGSFIVERVAEMARAVVQHISSVAEKEADHDMQKLAENFTLEKILAGIHYFRCHDYIELVALVNVLPQFVDEHPKVQLVVVDSVASPFRHGFTDMGMRNRILSGMAQNLIKLATLNNIAVVLTNQMTTKPHPHNPSSSQLVPALGESWGHVCTIRVVLYWREGQRYATLLKSPTQPEVVVPYRVTEEGVRDVIEDGAELLSSQEMETLQDWLFLSSSQLDHLESPEECKFAEEKAELRGENVLEVTSSRKRSHPEP